MNFRQIGSLMLPASYPEQTGLGCPKCDDHELVPIADVVGDPKSHETIQRFMRKHGNCGQLEQLEVKDGKLGVVGVTESVPS